MNFEDKIHEEILQTLERRTKIELTKLSFITAIFGAGVIGKIKLGGPTDHIILFGTLYIAPFVALACDCFILREIWSLRRMGDFLRQYGSDYDIKFENFVHGKVKRNPFYRIGSMGLTAITIAISIWLLYFQKSVYPIWPWNNHDYAWAVLSILFWIIVDVSGWILIWLKFDKNHKENADGE